ncbi:MAG: PH domain-containing protein [Actinomycetia bacterium]|nr:PH domain-containing protein [Actinomycetes bacterium]
MANSIAPVTSSRSSLIKPLDEQAVLVPNEQVYYAERQHWASIVQPVYETFIFLLFIIWIVDTITTSGLSNSWIGLILLGATIHAITLVITGGRAPTSRLAADPFSNPNGGGVRRGGVLGIGLPMVLVLIFFGPQVAGVAAVFIVITRLIIILARWSFYERRYITNRRVIESGGFLGSRISSMPLSRVTDISYSRTVPGEVFGYATMRVETAGQDQALGVVRFIAEPDHFYEVLINFSAPQAPVTDT